MTHAPGTEILVKNNVRADRTVHPRIVCAHYLQQRYVILTPDGDMYMEDYGNSEGIHWTRVRPARGAAPYGVRVGDIHEFEAYPSDDEMLQLQSEAEQECRRVALQEQVVWPAAAPNGARVGRVGAAAVGGDALVAREGGAPPRGAVLRPPAVGGVENQGGVGEFGGEAPGLAALAAALGGPLGGGGVPGTGKNDEIIQADRQDMRCLPVEYDRNGQRFRSFRDCADISEYINWPDWPVPGSQTASWCIKFMLARSGSAFLARYLEEHGATGRQRFHG